MVHVMLSFNLPYMMECPMSYWKLWLVEQMSLHPLQVVCPIYPTVDTMHTYVLAIWTGQTHSLLSEIEIFPPIPSLCPHLKKKDYLFPPFLIRLSLHKHEEGPLVVSLEKNRNESLFDSSDISLWKKLELHLLMPA